MTHNFSEFAFDYINPDNSKPSQGYDVPFFDTASEVVVPPVESFELQIDHDLAAFDEDQLQVLFDTAQFAGYRSNEPVFGPGSITASSHSAYDTVSTVSESFYSFPTSPAYAPSSFPFPIEMDFRSLTVGTIATASVLVERAAGQLPELDPEQSTAWTALRGQHARSMPR